MKRVKIFGVILSVGFILLLAFSLLRNDDTEELSYVSVELTDFEVDIEVKGEVRAASSVTINLPDEFFHRRNDLWEIQLTEIIPEGSHLKKGDYVATLDNSGVDKQIEEQETRIEKYQQDYDVAVVDTAVDLNAQRNKIEQRAYDLKEKEIILSQSVYESVAVQRKAEIDVQQAKRAYQNELYRYQSMQVHEASMLKRIQDRLDRYNNRKEFYEILKSKLKITAPEDGLLLYVRKYDGEKIKSGSILYRWSSLERQIAIIPNLDSLLSVVYINEIDITKVYPGQEVKISIEAMPDTEFKGTVMNIAKMGKKSRMDGSKVFKTEIYIQPNGADLKPSMSTSNSLLLESLTDVLVLPVNAIYSENNKNYVYQRDGLKTIKKEVQLGLQNQDRVIVERGLQKGDKCLTREPENFEKIDIVSLAVLK